MSKFKKGDRVVYEGLDHPRFGEVLGANDRGEFCVKWDGWREWEYDEHSGMGRYIELAPVPSPIREKTVKEFVPGKYGAFNVGSCKLGRVLIAQGYEEMLSADELREAARIFTDLASYLEDKEASQ